jgi:hypothetical protein
LENRSPLPYVILALAVAAALYVVSQPAHQPPHTITIPIPVPEPVRPVPPKCPGPNCPRGEGDTATAAGKGGSVVAGRERDGESVTADLPGQFWMKNIPSYADRKGMCVTTAIAMAGIYQGVPGIEGFRNWAAQFPGGAGPPKVDQQLKRYYREKFGTDPPPYYQYEGSDPVPVLEQIDRNGWLACHTYGYGPRYGGPIAHMVNGARFRGNYAVVLDSNFVEPAEQTYEWMSLSEAVQRIKSGGSAWVFCWLEPGPPPAPHN